MTKAKETKSYKINRTPVIAVMGHVDHGKTSLLDAIRGTNVQAGEVGGITQNTRAHQVEFEGHKLTFIDTPGHEAFSQMRSRGARVTDIVLLVVAADDGVQPQTRESIKFALEAKVPVIVAINKIDVPHKTLVTLKKELANFGVLLEEYGGDVIVNEVSAVTKEGIPDLMNSILLLSELLELKKDTPEVGTGTAFVLESTLNKTLGPVSLMIVKSGTLARAEFVVYEGGYSKIRTLLNHEQKQIETAEQGDPVWIVGIEKVLATGAYINVVKTEKEAKELLNKLKGGEVDLMAVEKKQEEEAEESDLDFLANLINDEAVEKEMTYLNLVLKADSKGTLEAIEHQFENIATDISKVKILSSGTGAISEQDIITAKNAHGIVIGFQVNVPKNVQEIARKEKVIVRNYDIIYDLTDEVNAALEGLLEPMEEEVEVSRARIKQVFVLSNKQHVAGCEVIKGTVIRGYKAYVDRAGERVVEGRISSLKQNKTEVKEVAKGQDCGIMFDPDFAFEDGDEVVCYKIEKY